MTTIRRRRREARFLAVALTVLCALIAGTSSAFASSVPAVAAGPWYETQVQDLSMTGTLKVSPLFVCGDRTICLYPNNDYTGTPTILDPANTKSGVWFSFDSIGDSSPHPGSINNDSGSSIYVYDKQEGAFSGIRCLTHGRYVLSHSYGYFELFYGNPDCSAPYTTPLP